MVAPLWNWFPNGTREDAQWASYSANKSHGLRRTNPDKQKAVKAALKHPNGTAESDETIATHIGVSRQTVIKYRHEMQQDGTCKNLTSRTGRDGRTINTTNIGKTKPEPEDDEPDEIGIPWLLTIRSPWLPAFWSIRYPGADLGNSQVDGIGICWNRLGAKSPKLFRAIFTGCQ